MACDPQEPRGTSSPDDAEPTACVVADTNALRYDEHLVSVAISGGSQRTYSLQSTAPQRDDAASARTVAEPRGAMRLRSGHVLFDALFALALHESREASVAFINDGSFANNDAIACECFETGEQWTYVWTRDTAYSVDLGLALTDPQRAANSLLFKLSRPKGGGERAIVQDTGTGGSWPVSTDRAIWALGARAVLATLDAPERQRFRDAALEALRTTIAEDRRYVFDEHDGLYRGEQSFLDWREQSYPRWTATDPVHIAMSKSLSTNVAHLILLELAAALADETSATSEAARYRDWAQALRTAIVGGLWQGDHFSALLTTWLDPAPVGRLDLLGSSLAVLEGVGDANMARQAIAQHPHSLGGPPVLWPQQPDVPIYHNRAAWPFVTAYALLAARQAENPAVFTAAARALVRGAALNLSNMENLEHRSGAPWVDDGPLSGPVVNSRRQLWSVAGYVGMVARGLFGIELAPSHLTVRPFVPFALRRQWFGAASELTLYALPYHGRRIDITLELPPCAAGEGYYAFDHAVLDGAPVDGPVFPRDALHDGSTLRIVLRSVPTEATPVRTTPTDRQGAFAPREPLLRPVWRDGDDLVLEWQASEDRGLGYHVYRDGVQVAELGATSWRDVGAATAGAPCYVVEAEFLASGNRSHHSRPQCYWGERGERVMEVDARAFSATGGTLSQQYGRWHYQQWGAPQDALTASVAATSSGEHLVQAVYGNGAGSVTTGITTAVKWLRVIDDDSGELAGEGPLIMPQLGSWDLWAESSFVRASLLAGRRYRLELTDGRNMSYLDHFTRYNGAGGGSSPYNQVNVAALRVLAR